MQRPTPYSAQQISLAASQSTVSHCTLPGVALRSASGSAGGLLVDSGIGAIDRAVAVALVVALVEADGVGVTLGTADTLGPGGAEGNLGSTHVAPAARTITPPSSAAARLSTNWLATSTLIAEL